MSFEKNWFQTWSKGKIILFSDANRNVQKKGMGIWEILLFNVEKKVYAVGIDALTKGMFKYECSLLVSGCVISLM